MTNTFYIVETYIGTRDITPIHKPGWTFDIYEDKNEIPEVAFTQYEIHAIWKYRAEDRDCAEEQFRCAMEAGSFDGLQLAIDRRQLE